MLRGNLHERGMQASVAEDSASVAAAEGNKDIDELYALERVHWKQMPAVLNWQCAAADAEFERERQQLLRAMVQMVDEYQVHNSVVYLAAALLDLSHVLKKGQEYDLPKQALAVFLLAVKFSGMCPAQPSLSAYCRSWKQRLGIRHDAFAVRHLRAAEVELFELLDWRINVATVDRFLEAFLATHANTDNLLNQWAMFCTSWTNWRQMLNFPATTSSSMQMLLYFISVQKETPRRELYEKFYTKEMCDKAAGWYEALSTFY